jgi:Flp pilus assembly pilin Flp
MVSKLKAAKFTADERGASVLEVAILLPLAILIVVGGFEIWKLMMLKRALYIGAYQSARYFANYERAPHMGVTAREEQARRFILSELEGTRLYSAEMPIEKITVRMNALGCAAADPNETCGGYGVYVEVSMRAPVKIPPFFAVYPDILTLRGVYNYDPCRRCG